MRIRCADEQMQIKQKDEEIRELEAPRWGWQSSKFNFVY